MYYAGTTATYVRLSGYFSQIRISVKAESGLPSQSRRLLLLPDHRVYRVCDMVGERTYAYKYIYQLWKRENS